LSTKTRFSSRGWAIAAVVIGVSLLMTMEVIEEPDLSWREFLFDLIDPTLIVMTAVGVVYLFGRVERQHEEQLLLVQDLHVARAEGAQWRTDMRELLEGLGEAINAQFDRWSLTVSEREVAMLMLKGLSHKEIAVIRSSSERTVRQQATAIYGKANLSGRAALSAFFLEDLLLPMSQRG
jgi:DNA-binding CsgD family transcriptional regulator